MNKTIKQLHDECVAYMKFGQEIHPSYVQEMIDKAFKAGYEQAILNYCDPYVERK